jgi:AAA ATPase domain
VEGFVGRANELTAIEALLATSRRERRVAALILVGEPGIGKSRLLDEAEGRHRDGSILRFAGYEPEASVPLASASALLRYLAAASEDRTFHGLLDPDTEVGGLDAIRIFESVHRQLARLRPAALFVDDLQWVDPVSIALCHFLVRATDGSGRGFALVVASRPSPMTDRFGASLANAIGNGAVPATIQLRPLGREEGIRFVADRSSALERGGAIDLWERAGGSPFWLDLLVRTQGDERDFETVVAARTRALSPDAAALLRILAILGRPIDAIELEALVAWPTARTIAASTELGGHGLALDEGGVMRLAHDLIRDVVVRGIPDAARRELHGRIATALEREAASDAPRLLAALEHRAAAGTFDVGLALRILASPQRRLIGSDGVRRIIESACELEDVAIRVRVDQAAATLAEELGDQALALDRWSTLAGATGDPSLAARAEFGAARAAYHLGRRDEARRWLDGSRARAVPSADLDIARDALEARILLWLEHRTDEGRSVAMRGVERGRLALAEGDVTQPGAGRPPGCADRRVGGRDPG